MTIQEIRNKQKELGFAEMQKMIDDGLPWRLEGSVGREAVRFLKVGICFLPLKSFRDFYGNYIPSRKEVKPMTTGSLQLSKKYYTEL